MPEKMIERFELQGQWFLPSWSADRRLRGTLRFHPSEGIVLELKGSFEPSLVSGEKYVLNESVVRYEAIHGLTEFGRKISLLDCSGMRVPNLASLVIPGFGQKCTGTFLVIGEHLQGMTDFTFSTIRIRYFTMEECVGLAPIRASWPAAWPLKSEAINVAFQSPKPITFYLDTFRIETEHHVSWSPGSHFDKAEIQHEAWISAEASPEVPFSDFIFGPFRTLQMLFDLMAGCHLPMIAAQGESSRFQQEIGDRMVPAPLDIFFSQSRILPLPSKRSAHPPQPDGLLFTLASLGNSLPNYVSNWHKFVCAHAPTLQLYFSLDPERDSKVPIDYHFLSLIFALESHHATAHRECVRCEALSAEKEKWLHFAKREFADRANISSDAVNWISRSLAASTGPSLSERLSEIVDEQSPRVKSALGDKNAFVRAVRDNRHALAHGSVPSGAKATAATFAKWRLVLKLRLLMQSIFLESMAIPRDVVEMVLTNTIEYRHLSSRTEAD